jgi:DNA repair exonuclease SbcCD ATPase subunit
MKKLRQRITLNDVSQAINSLKEQNLNPTADNILAEIIRSSNGTVGGSKGTVLKLKRQLESTDNCTNSSTVKSTSTVQYSTNKRTDSTKSIPINLDDKLLSTLEVQLWSRLEVRLDDKLREKLEVHQVSELPHDRADELEEALQEMCELWLDSITQYTAAKANLDVLEKQVTQLNSEVQQLSESEAQAAELHQVNERLVLETNELKSKLEAIQHERQIQNEAATNQVIQFQSTLNQAANQIEAQQTQLNQLSQNLDELRELWLDAVFQIQIATSSAAASVITGTDPLETYFQILTQLHHLTPAQKYDYAMKLFERGMGPSEVSRILAVNKGSLQHYKEGKRKRPEEE